MYLCDLLQKYEQFVWNYYPHNMLFDHEKVLQPNATHVMDEREVEIPIYRQMTTVAKHSLLHLP